ncbi:Anaphase-promoting complex subunit 1 [Recurvomyces mirabilis]|nr:Anaphase-promoting complex subunit 1 [Recurvomyces mirabilis]
MAKVESLGINTPVALPYLIREGLLPADPKKTSYRWQTYISGQDEDQIDEELLVTEHCVVWSQGKCIRNVYRFELEGEAVSQAILTQFAPSITISEQESSSTNGEYTSPTHSSRHGQSKESGEQIKLPTKPVRALVVFLKSKAHVYYLHGARHILDLPFEIERAFPAPRGCLLQRRIIRELHVAPTPHLPSAPPNSFFSSQLRPQSSHLQSPTLVRSFGRPQPAKSSPRRGRGGIDGLLQDVLGSPAAAATDEVASLYSFTDPLASFGVVTTSYQHQKPRLSTKHRAGVSVDFEALAASEQMVYVTPDDELSARINPSTHAVLLVVTYNNDTQLLTVWHGWYIEEKSLRALFKQREAQKAAKARRRSSYMSVTAGTGATTPAVRARESFAAAGTLRPPAEHSTAQHTAQLSRKSTRAEQEEAMASQMDPDYQPPVPSQPPMRETRRISSLNADLRTSQTAGVGSFTAGGGRRNASFGGHNDRKSFGHRKSRGSTPGSVFSRSLGPDDDLMDIDSSGNYEHDENLDSIVQHIRATFDAAGVESVFGNVDDGYRRELVVRNPADTFRAATLKAPRPDNSSEDDVLGLYVQDMIRKEISHIVLTIKRRRIWPEMADSTTFPIPVMTHVGALKQTHDLLKLHDGRRAALLVLGQGLILSGNDTALCPLPAQASYRVHNPFDVLTGSISPGSEAGKNRLIQPAQGSLAVTNAGAGAAYDEVDGSGVHHRRRLKLGPVNRYVEKLLTVCETVLPVSQAARVRATFCTAFAWVLANRDCLKDTGCGAEWIAFTATVLSFMTGLLDNKARAALKLARLASGKQNAGEQMAIFSGRQQRQERALSCQPWSWLAGSHAAAVSASTVATRKDQLLSISAALADDLSQTSGAVPPRQTSVNAVNLLHGLHLFREEQKLSTLSVRISSELALEPIIAQLGTWLGLQAWSGRAGSYYAIEGGGDDKWAFVKSSPPSQLHKRPMDEPTSVHQWFERALQGSDDRPFPDLVSVVAADLRSSPSEDFGRKAKGLTPRACALSAILEETGALSVGPSRIVDSLAKHQVDSNMLESLPQGLAAPFREAIARCEREPPTSWSQELLQLVGREDLVIQDVAPASTSAVTPVIHSESSRDLHAICHALEQPVHAPKTREAARHGVSQLIFHQDRRLVDAAALMRYYSTQEAECPKQPDWSDGHHLDQQRSTIAHVTVRMWALPAGDGMIHYDCLTPLLTEKYIPHGFGSKCLMHPMGNVLHIDRTTLSEEKVGWAYFHAGVSGGLRISKQVKGIDTSWVAFNKPVELTNRHAGLLLALGLGGHLKSLAKWLSFKYLTPKHTMTSVGLLLGLSASYIGTMDSLITRMLSVHITRMLPPGAAELNVSAITQTAGLMGIGLLYYDTQHRRMSEIMLSEVEYMEVEDPDSGPDRLRDESYRLAAGFALGLVNLGKGKSLNGLHGMRLPERLLAVAIGPRPVRAVHVFDRATAGSIIALTLIYMKTGDKGIAAKVDIPDAAAQFEHVRPDMLLLRAMARHIIMWDDIKTVHRNANPGTAPGWIESNLPACYHSTYRALSSTKLKQPLQTTDVPFYNILTGLAWALGLKYAGSGNEDARDEVLSALDLLHHVAGESYYYDAKLTRATVRRCVDVLALVAATIMAGTGDLQTFRYLRRLHGRTDAETPYGSHMAAHLAMGVLFMGGGTYTFGTSNLAIASLICAFYPLFPADVHDNRVHLQAFRHFWVFAAEARCLVVEDVDTGRPIRMPVKLSMRDGSKKVLTAPCLLPELDTIVLIQTTDSAYWPLTLDFANQPSHLEAFRSNQTVHVRRCPAAEAHGTVFSATLAALNDASQSALSQPSASNNLWQSLFTLPALKDLDKADWELVLPPDVHSCTHLDERGTVVDDRLVLGRDAGDSDVDRLRALKVLFTWAEKVKVEGGGEMRWLGDEVVQKLKARIEERSRLAV